MRECRAQGFWPGNLNAYTCRTCGGTFGWKSFSQNARHYGPLRQPERDRLECLQCQKTASHGSPICRRCVRYDHLWKQQLGLGAHGCSVCKKVFEASHWNDNLIRQHRSKNRDLVCSGCSQRGHVAKTYNADDYKEYECTSCLKSWGSGKFDRHMLYDAKRKKGSTLLCKECQRSFRCGSCHEVFERERWMTCRMSKLVCRGCRAQGFRAQPMTSS